MNFLVCLLFFSSNPIPVKGFAPLHAIIPRELRIKTKYNIPGSNNQLESEKNFTPQKGDLIYYLWESARGTYDESNRPIVVSHVDMVMSFDGSTIQVIGGNRGSSIVSGRDYQRLHHEIVGFARPDYTI